MPYKCTVCNKLYKEGSPELKEVMSKGGCSCGKKFLMYVSERKDEHEEETAPDAETPIRDSIRAEIEEKRKELRRDDLEWLGKKLVRMRESDEPIYLGIETIRVLEEGKYELDVASLMRGKPLIIKSEAGVYYIDLPYSMKKR